MQFLTALCTDSKNNWKALDCTHALATQLRQITSFTSVDVIGSVIRTGEARLEMFLPDTAAPTTGVATVKPSFRESGATGKREDKRYREYSRPTLSSVTFANTSAGSSTDILEILGGGRASGGMSVVEVLCSGIMVVTELLLPLPPPLLLPSLLPLSEKVAWSKKNKTLQINNLHKNFICRSVTTLPKPDPGCISASVGVVTTRTVRSNCAPFSCSSSRLTCR